METDPERTARKENGDGDCTQGFEFTETVGVLLRRWFLGQFPGKERYEVAQEIYVGLALTDMWALGK
jgi:hypothetical protein